MRIEKFMNCKDCLEKIFNFSKVNENICNIKISGIYCIMNLFNNKVYIGSSQNIYVRRQKHFSLLRLNKHKNKHLQNSYNLYGKEMFYFFIIEECFIDKLLSIEQFWMDFYQSYNNKNGFNIIKDTNGMVSFKGGKHTKEYKEMLGNLMRGKPKAKNEKCSIKTFCEWIY